MQRWLSYSGRLKLQPFVSASASVGLIAGEGVIAGIRWMVEPRKLNETSVVQRI
jgi:hypothetical protein